MNYRLHNAYDLDKKCVIISDEETEGIVHTNVVGMGYVWHSGSRERFFHFSRIKAPYFLCFDQIPKSEMIARNLQVCPFRMKFELTPPVGYELITINL